MLAGLADFLEEQERLRERVQGALIYPAIVFAVGICVAILMLGLLLPRARDILANTDEGLPGVTAFMIGLGRFLQHWGIGLALVLVAGGGLAWRRARRDPKWRMRLSRMLFRAPVLGRGWITLVSLRFARTMSILLQGGVPVMDSLRLAGRATGDPWVTASCETEADAVRHGSSLSDAVRRIPPLAHSLPGWIEVGEAGGGLVRLLGAAARRYQAQWDRYLSRCLALLEPLLIFLIGGFVLLVTLSVLLPVVSLSQAVGR
jgi:general secretion pathway protein F